MVGGLRVSENPQTRYCPSLHTHLAFREAYQLAAGNSEQPRKSICQMNDMHANGKFRREPGPLLAQAPAAQSV